MLLWGQSTPSPSTPHGMCICGGKGWALKGLFLCLAFVYKSYYIPDSRGCPSCMVGDPVCGCTGQDGIEAQRGAFSQQLPPGH